VSRTLATRPTCWPGALCDLPRSGGGGREAAVGRRHCADVRWTVATVQVRSGRSGRVVEEVICEGCAALGRKTDPGAKKHE
jgi:hypothetical protein